MDKQIDQALFFSQVLKRVCFFYHVRYPCAIDSVVRSSPPPSPLPSPKRLRAGRRRRGRDLFRKFQTSLDRLWLTIPQDKSQIGHRFALKEKKIKKGNNLTLCKN